MKRILFLVLFTLVGVLSAQTIPPHANNIQLFNLGFWKLQPGQVTIDTSAVYHQGDTLTLHWAQDTTDLDGNTNTPPTTYNVTGESAAISINNIGGLWDSDTARVTLNGVTLTGGTWIFNVRPVSVSPTNPPLTNYGPWSNHNVYFYIDEDLTKPILLRITVR